MKPWKEKIWILIHALLIGFLVAGLCCLYEGLSEYYMGKGQQYLARMLNGKEGIYCGIGLLCLSVLAFLVYLFLLKGTKFFTERDEE